MTARRATREQAVSRESPSSVVARQFLAADLTGIRVRVAQNSGDLADVAKVRAESFGRLQPRTSARSEGWVEEADLSSNAKLLIAYDALETPIATLRFQDERDGEIEVARRLDLDRLAAEQDRPFGHIARLCAARHPRRADGMLALFRGIWRRARADGIQSFIITSPYWSRGIYDMLMFRDCGDAGISKHQLTGRPTCAMVLDIQAAEARYVACRHPLYDRLVTQSHPDCDI